MMMKLGRDFFDQPTLYVAQLLLGKTVVFNDFHGIITETEAYVGQDDPACHAARGITPRTQVMFGIPGLTYVYLIYGMYHCLNFVTEAEGNAGAVLIRGLKLILPYQTHFNGPGKLCKNLGITLIHNKIDLVTSEVFYVLDNPSITFYQTTPRIGISKGQDKLWRFVAEVIP